ncbi:hypothetical protein QPK32_05490 [Massilia sp. YIM B02763]|uniref:hypothetical protein n=1 Tax=Massilia sp. YIM B02763 TaxID=3050130 RepID=UPI0025B6BCFE|nr:hypothetical protein [Massilia sp. YIM B02763]MDN4052519.1 hypothetical protein [Massilia sp. YIM B02763]
MSFTDIALRNAKSDDKQTKLFNKRGLFLLVTRLQGKLWCLKISARRQGEAALIGILT